MNQQDEKYLKVIVETLPTDQLYTLHEFLIDEMNERKQILRIVERSELEVATEKVNGNFAKQNEVNGLKSLSNNLLPMRCTNGHIQEHKRV